MKTPLAIGACVTLLSLPVASCGYFSKQPSPKEVAGRIVEDLRGVPEEKTRATATVLTLNTMCTLSRLASGNADGRVEHAVAGFINRQPEGIKARLRGFGDTLAEISTQTRQELLGDFSAFDPSLCAAAPRWDGLRRAIIYNHRLLPRLRANFCSGNFNYAGGASGQRAVTVATQLEIQPIPDGGGPDFYRYTPSASPVVLGVEGEFVSARHPALAATAASGEGITPWGVGTGIPCSTTNDSCDASQGLICSTKLPGGGGSTGQCAAFPVVQKDHDLVLRGFNYWDITEARLVLTPVVPGQGSESTSIVSLVDANEPTDGTQACPRPTPGNATYNRAHFRIPANEGAFYRIRIYNHNGSFLTQRDAADDADPRVIHVCYPDQGSGNPDNVPPGTIRNCTLPVETCPQDGVTCTATWSTPPRQLQNCGHQPGQASPCGETPEWFASELLARRADGLDGAVDGPIVFIEGKAPVYAVTGTLKAVESVEETGVDILGSDEPLIGIVALMDPGASAEDIVQQLDDLPQTFKGEDFDSGTRKRVDHVLVRVGALPADGRAFFKAYLAEDDSFAGAFAAGVVAIAAAAAIIILSGGAAIAAAAGGGAGLALLWGVVVNEYIAEDEALGRASFSGTPIEFQERIGATHSDNFLTTNPPLFGVLPKIEPPAPNEHVFDSRSLLIHPFADFRVIGALQAECNPGVCSSGQECQVNRCVETGFIDPTKDVGFRERRAFIDSDSWGVNYFYGLDLQWEIRKTN